ncbi:glycosyltransferase [Larsenimonas rhizosphaerae]|uniref:Glycosyltransferase n=1 Tax=Larsenimonas rhizosphaerae TaxID=2944682 RepID=A0AA41ZFY0_9GAMM|nr:glycosyltransferase [Larsenimonas rhizosphaerae]MCM2130468.1 glycosyltransferase [Larsenimonas rhizosphaerae]MCX2523173.1 glycosyltransferase [Larsenimonas rhizosphaerae]
MPFSVLMSIYVKEKPDYLRLCLESLDAQTLKADEVVIVEDGPIGDDLRRIIDEYRERISIVSVPLQTNVGLGAALNAGLAQCHHELVARMDTDDLCRPDRFEKQVRYFEQYPDTDVLGGAISEFNVTPQQPHAIRELPVGRDKVREFAKARCPVNHMTVMFRKSAIDAAGGYQPFLGMEDYYLWARLLVAGQVMDNMADILVDARVGNGMLTRRRGWHYFKQDVILQNKFRKMGFISTGECVLNAAKRAPLRLAPEWLLALVYQRFLRKSVS